MATEQPATLPEHHRGHESDELRIGGFVWFLAVFVVTAIAINLLLYWMYGAMLGGEVRPAASPVADTTPLPPEPRLQGSAAHRQLPNEDLTAMRAEEDRQLNSYAWVDSNSTVARVPIERAMAMLAARGLPTTQPAQK